MEGEGGLSHNGLSLGCCDCGGFPPHGRGYKKTRRVVIHSSLQRSPR